MDVEREIVSTVGGSDLGFGDDDSIGSLAVGSILLNNGVFMRSIDGDLDGDGTTTDLLALESVDGLLLFILVTNVDETIPLAFSGLAPPPSDDASVGDVDARLGEESGETRVVDVEAKVGNEENGFGGFAHWVLTGGTGETGSPEFALPGFGNTICGRVGCGIIWARSGGLSFARPGLVTALKHG